MDSPKYQARPKNAAYAVVENHPQEAPLTPLNPEFLLRD